MSRVSISIPEEVRWDELVMRRFLENAPYYLDGARVHSIAGREVRFEAVAAPLDLQTRGEALARRIAGELRDAAEVIVADYQPQATLPRHPDPMPALIASRALVRTGRGRFVYGGLLLGVMESLDRILARYAAERGAEPQLYPSTVNAATLIRSGYLKSFPQHAYYVAPTALASESLVGIAGSTSADSLSSPGASAWFGAHDQMLAPTVCYHCFESQQGQRMETPRSFTAVNHCSRFEVDGDVSLARLHTFRMRELIVFGDADHVSTLLDHALGWTTELLRRWGVPHRVATATDPFFAGAQSGKVFYQATFALKRELRMPVPFDGSWLAVASFNNHQQSLTRAFDIAGPAPLASGCVGWGYERIVYALLANLGVEPSAWPEPMRADLGIKAPMQ